MFVYFVIIKSLVNLNLYFILSLKSLIEALKYSLGNRSRKPPPT